MVIFNSYVKLPEGRKQLIIPLLVGGDWNMNFYEIYFSPYIGNVIILTDELHHFSEG